jgi:hypothetical protein
LHVEIFASLTAVKCTRITERAVFRVAEYVVAGAAADAQQQKKNGS